MAGLRLSVEELVALLRNSTMPTVLVEGDDDLAVLRWIDDQLGVACDVLPCEGRNNVFRVHARQAEFPRARVAFLADRDLWYFQGIPNGYDDVVFTVGYSIENDAYVDGDPESSLDASERELLGRLMASVCRWFAFEIALAVDLGKPEMAKFKLNIRQDLQGDSLSPAFLLGRGFVEPSPERLASIRDHRQAAVRGKLLFQLLAYVAPRHGKTSMKWMEWVVKQPAPKTLLSQLVQTLRQRLGV